MRKGGVGEGRDRVYKEGLRSGWVEEGRGWGREVLRNEGLEERRG